MFIRRIHPRKKFQTYIKYMMILWILYLYYVKLLVLLCEETVQPVWNWFLLAGTHFQYFTTICNHSIYLIKFSFVFEKKQRIFLPKWDKQDVPNHSIINFRLLSHSLNSLSQQQSNRTKKISSEIDIAAIIQLSKTFFCDDIFKSLHS